MIWGDTESGNGCSYNMKIKIAETAKNWVSCLKNGMRKKKVQRPFPI